MMTCTNTNAEGPPQTVPIEDERFDGLTQLARRHFSVATALILREEAGQVRVHSCSGEPCMQWPIPLSPTGLQVSCPITTKGGEHLGAFILLDEQHRQLSDTELQLLAGLADLAAVAVGRDRISAVLKQEVDQLRESEHRMALAIANSGTGVWDRNVVSGEILYSDGWKAILGYAEDELTSYIDDSYQRVHPDDLAYVKATIEAHFRQQSAHYEVEHRIRCKDGSYKWICSRGKVVSRDSDDKPLRMIGTTTDITERKRLEAELQARATIDFLTQLPNRRHFMQQLDIELSRAQRCPGHQATVLMCDLDHFKAINDQWGHAVGDRALKYFAGILAGQLREVDIAGRIGGEEFAVVLSGGGNTEARTFGERLQAKLASTPLVDGGRLITLTISIGISPLLASDDSPDAALSRSDQALYRAKQNGRNRIEGD